MISAEPSRLGMNHRFADSGVADGCEIARRLALEIEFDGFTQVGDGFLSRPAKAGDFDVEALGDEELLLTIDTVGDRLHPRKVSRAVRPGNDG
jgi:hypothetical protein